MDVRITGDARGIFVATAVAVAASALSWSVELPAGPLANLGSEEFRKREAAQSELLGWAREQSEPAIDELFRQSREAADPEVRERCLDILRKLVEDEYLKDGQGYVGINMLNEMANVPGDPVARAVIRVMIVMPDSAAEHAGIQLNDLIVGLGDEVWHQGLASTQFTEKIIGMKPGTKVKLKVLRNGNVMEIEVKLGKRPFFPDNLLFEGRLEDFQAAEKEDKEAYFRTWLEQRKSRK